jgi:hypothetical protein
MPNLFIIGNGFDIAHGLKTRYIDFRKFLLDKYTVDTEEWLSLTRELYKQKNDFYQMSDKIIANFIVHALDRPLESNYLWRDFEDDLSNLPVRGLFDYSSWQDVVVDSSKKSTRLQGSYSINETYAQNISKSMVRLVDFFSDWITDIDALSVDAKNSFVKIANTADDLFLTFNYTHTLERVYNCKTVCHIHGDTKGTILLGHGRLERVHDTIYMDRSCPGVGENMTQLWNLMKKDTDLARDQALWFFNLLRNIDCVYSIGFSYSDVDLCYIKKICKILSNSTSFWSIETYPGLTEILHYQQKIRNSGFKGRFAKFTM